MQLVTTRRFPRLAFATVIVLTIGFTSCGDDDAEDATIPFSEWVDAFDAMCVEVTTQSPNLTEEEFTELSDRSLAEMRALPPPDENAAAATEVLDAIEASTDPSVEEGDIESLDRRALAALDAIGAVRRVHRWPRRVTEASRRSLPPPRPHHHPQPCVGISRRSLPPPRPHHHPRPCVG